MSYDISTRCNQKCFTDLVQQSIYSKQHNYVYKQLTLFILFVINWVVTYLLSRGGNRASLEDMILSIPHTTSCGGYNVFDPSVSQSVSLSVSQSVSPSVLFFLVSATPLKPLNRISWNFVVMKDIMCRYTFLREMLIWSFWGAICIPFFLSDCPSLMLGIAIHCIQHSQAILERGVCEFAHSFFH